ncbi:MAG: metallophosphoesterase family protein [Deltaproteobacteria bacterium]|nr:metallophosphoesterase family protein [Deltaproteobacteria bacterium]
MLERIAAQEPDLLLHAGDIGDLSVLEELRELAPLIAVRGNIDERGEDLPDSIALELTLAGEAHFSLLLTHVALRGPRLLPRVAERAQQDACALVVCGHSHIPFLGKDRGLGIFNPGSVGPRRFHLPITLGVMALRDSTLSLRHVDVESGETWSP